jgi:NAD(P)-dependent dehydrogenase (short-subunit alcohol dehydrogenase family)
MPSAVVLGGGGGIGASVCAALAHTHAVVVGYHRNHERAQSVVDKITTDGGTATAWGADATVAAGIDAAVTAAEGLGPLRTVVHCVGAWDYTRVGDLDEDIIDRDHRINLRSALLTLSAAAHRVADHGRIIMLSSAAAYLAPARQASYVAMEAGIEGTTRVTAKNLESARSRSTSCGQERPTPTHCTPRPTRARSAPCRRPTRCADWLRPRTSPKRCPGWRPLNPDGSPEQPSMPPAGSGSRHLFYKTLDGTHNICRMKHSPFSRRRPP